ncbi:MAG: LytTR family DNA-binding domain-containing protein [Butyrivibrio sp.]|nr:LytTR family DNA-binding domain-containing protein [Butyrivibrio sp.]
MKIAVCDDNADTLNILKDMLETRTDIDLAHYYDKIENFWESVMHECVYDVVLMDIDWEGTDMGIDFANRLLDKNINSQIIYMTGYNDRFSQQIFLTPSNLCGYLVKPVEEKMLDAMLVLAAKAIDKARKQRLIIKKRNGICSISYNDIIWISSELRKAIIHCREGEHSYNGSLSELKKLLPSSFTECHKSFWVNMDYIKRIGKTEVEMLSGATVPVSRAKYGIFLERYMKYMGYKI